MDWTRFVPAGALVLLPLIAAAADLGVAATLFWLLVVLAAGWLVRMRELVRDPRGPGLILESMGASHFVEKVRWSLDRLGVPYEERIAAGVMGVMFLGRTLPRLHMRTGRVWSRMGNSSEILRYLWGRYAVERRQAAAFLIASDASLEVERRLDAYGVDMQRWVYFHVLGHPNLLRHVWGSNDPRVPAWQRVLLVPLTPLLAAFLHRVFRISPQGVARSRERIEALLGELEQQLGSDGGQRGLLGEARSYVDLTLASLSAFWVLPAGFAGGVGDSVLPTRDRVPPSMEVDVQRWRTLFPVVTSFVERLYATERRAAGG